MTKFLIGLLLGLILGAAGASGFLITAGGGASFVGASPRVRELEASLREGQQERQWLRGRLSAGSAKKKMKWLSHQMRAALQNQGARHTGVRVPVFPW